MLRKIRIHMSILAARLGILFLEKSGVFSGYFSEWRWAVFDWAERRGLHVLPVHYYSPIPEVGRLELDDQEARFAYADNDALDNAVRDIAALVVRYGTTYAEIAGRRPYSNSENIEEFRFGIAPYSTGEAELLYGLIRSKKPNQILEVGSGHTTLLISEAIRDEAKSGYNPHFECIEPYRPDYLNPPPSEVTRFCDTPLQSIGIERFKQLEAGDILFIDSSHVVSYASDVVYEIASILPNLEAGVLVHFHDIFLPYDYPSDWIGASKFFWNEQYMLSAMLRGNPRYRIKYPLYQLFRQRRDTMENLFPLLSEGGHRPGAYWLEILGPNS